MLRKRVAVASLIIYAVLAAFSMLLLAAAGTGLPVYILLRVLGLVAAAAGDGRIRLLAVAAVALALAGAVSDRRAGSDLQARVKRIHEMARQRAAAATMATTQAATPEPAAP